MEAVDTPPDPASGPVPNVVPPTVNVTEPTGEALPDTAPTVATTTVLPPAEMLEGFAATTVVVAVAGTVTVTVALPTEPPNPSPPPYVALIVLPPAASWLPLTVTLAVDVPPDPVRFAFPSVTLPNKNATDPGGDVVPLDARTVAVSVVEPAGETVEGLAASVVVVGPPTGAVTVTVTDPFEEPNPVTPPYVAVMLFPPVESWLPFTVTLAVEVPAEPESEPVPNVASLRLKVTVPPGDTVPLAAFTVAVSVVEAETAKLAGLAATVVAVLVTDVAFHPVISL